MNDIGWVGLSAVKDGVTKRSRLLLAGCTIQLAIQRVKAALGTDRVRIDISLLNTPNAYVSKDHTRGIKVVAVAQTAGVGATRAEYYAVLTPCRLDTVSFNISKRIRARIAEEQPLYMILASFLCDGKALLSIPPPEPGMLHALYIHHLRRTVQACFKQLDNLLPLIRVYTDGYYFKVGPSILLTFIFFLLAVFSHPFSRCPGGGKLSHFSFYLLHVFPCNTRSPSYATSADCSHQDSSLTADSISCNTLLLKAIVQLLCFLLMRAKTVNPHYL
mmetsp:Transcript_8228/g.21860  ORF Transcript_8228/g.21860 Transcript_8228/m.21860 type:complete len:274 (-) Transcript_8228:2113-2934(-)